MHMHFIEDESGDTIDALHFCSDSCHRDFTGSSYAGWSGCHESEFTRYCDACGVVIPGLDDACEHQRDNVVVNRFRRTEGERCSHGNWIQVPSGYLAAV